MQKIEENNRIGKTRDLFKKIRDTKGAFHAKIYFSHHKLVIFVLLPILIERNKSPLVGLGTLLQKNLRKRVVYSVLL